MVGSNDSIAAANTTLNAIVAEAFCEAADELEKADDFEAACTALVKKYMTEHQRIVFNGDGYSDAWVAEAARRGLPNIPSMVAAVPALTTDKAVKLFEKFHIFTKVELESRAEVLYEGYAKIINIEAQTCLLYTSLHDDLGINTVVVDVVLNFLLALLGVDGRRALLDNIGRAVELGGLTAVPHIAQADPFPYQSTCLLYTSRCV